MIVEFDKSFGKSIEKLKDQTVLAKIEKLILKMETATSITEITGVKKLSGHKTYYRIRIGDYRMGFEKIGEKIRLIVIANRKDIYSIFP
jgi:mRNA interferase RelE/StbE